MALMDSEVIPMELLSRVERKGASVLVKHALVKVDSKGLGESLADAGDGAEAADRRCGSARGVDGGGEGGHRQAEKV